METPYHIPALLDETLALLNLNPEGIYLDLTYGGGGHSRALLARLSEKGRLLAFDQDPETAKQALQDPRFSLYHVNFKAITSICDNLGLIGKVDGILADLGVSFRQLDNAAKGFTYKGNAKLDMRMNPIQPFSAIELLNNYSEVELTRVLREYGELPGAHKLAEAICKYRSNSALKTANELNTAVERFTPKKDYHQFYAKLYQALRIEVNQELEALKELLMQSVKVLKKDGRMAIISYHSLEDRLTKHWFHSGSFDGVIAKDFYGNPQLPWLNITRKPVTPNTEEIQNNSRSRSAKLRVAVKI